MGEIKERIYIGGLNPPRLSAKDILKRLNSIDQIQIEAASSRVDSDDDDDKPYLHITAVSKEDSDSALSIISKQYHNVKWKGCKLLVEKAKPHFLDRLAQERKDRESKQEDLAVVGMAESLYESVIPRRLRVRKKFGDVALHVDTKPWTVDNWSRFDKARNKLQKKEEKHAQKGDQSMMHRAIHIRFQDVVDQKTGMVSSSSSSESSDSDSSSSEESEKYDWSDSESEASNKDLSKVDDGDDCSQSTAELLSNQDRDKAENEKKYQWSTDEESSDDETNQRSGLPERKNQPLRGISGTDEFAAGFDDASTVDGTDSDNDEYQEVGDRNADSDLIEDVATNLNILSSIFPDMEDAKPVPLGTEEEKDTSTCDSNPSASTNRKGTVAPFGMMPRFDPTAKSSSQFIVQEESADEKESTERSVSEGDALEENENENLAPKKAPPVEGVYEQDKLEDVFRDARDAWKTDKSEATSTSPTTSGKNTASGTSGFSFGFEVEDHASSTKESTPKEAKGAFSFSFFAPSEDPKEGKGNGENEVTTPHIAASERKNEASNDDDDDDEEMIDAETDIPKRCKGLAMPKEDLQTYVDNFFSINDGIRVMQNPEGFRNDESVKAAWNKERQTLTLDWKRKRKYATSRIQKRMKHGRR